MHKINTNLRIIWIIVIQFETAKLDVNKHTETPRKTNDYADTRDEERVQNNACAETISTSDTCQITEKKNSSKIGIIDDDISDNDERGEIKEISSGSINMGDDFGNGSDEGGTQPEGPQDDLGNKVCVLFQKKNTSYFFFNQHHTNHLHNCYCDTHKKNRGKGNILFLFLIRKHLQPEQKKLV